MSGGQKKKNGGAGDANSTRNPLGGEKAMLPGNASKGK